MTTTPRKTNAHKKARALSSGFLRVINTFVLIPRQGLADKRTSFGSVMKHHTNDSSTPVCDITSVRAAKCDKSKAYGLLINGGLSNECRQTEK